MAEQEKTIELLKMSEPPEEKSRRWFQTKLMLSPRRQEKQINGLVYSRNLTPKNVVQTYKQDKKLQKEEMPRTSKTNN